jgi:hypothetical protein
MPDRGAPASYLTLTEGTPVYGRDGGEVGSVSHVLSVPEDDIFDGLVIRTDSGHRFCDAPLVGEIYERGVELTIPARECARLPEPSASPAAMEVGADDMVPDTMHDKLKRAWDLLSGKP